MKIKVGINERDIVGLIGIDLGENKTVTSVLF